MKRSEFIGRRRGRAAVWCVIAASWLGLSANFALCAQAPAPPPTTPAASHAVDLEYQEQSHPIISRYVSFFPQFAPFAREPGFGQRLVARGNIKFGSDPQELQAVAWDFTESKLYVDLNHNDDLTDDGVFRPCEGNYRDSYYPQTFTNIHLSFKTAAGLRHLLVDLQFRGFGIRPNVRAGWRSLWAGTLSLQGKDWQVGFLEVPSVSDPNPYDYLVLRPWLSRSREVNIDDGPLDGFRFCTNVFCGQQAYRVDCALVRRSPKGDQTSLPAFPDSASVQGADSPQYRLTFTEWPAQLGELRLTGKYIERLLLTSAQGHPPLVVVLDRPEPVVRVPVGRYEPQVYLEQGSVGARRERPYPDPGWLSVNSGVPTVRAIGGPLTNTVSVSGRARQLNLGYRSLGAGGDAYKLTGAREQPQFAIYQAGQQIASGKFRFG